MAAKTTKNQTLREELKKKRGFDSVEQEAMLSILRTSDLLDNRLARLLRQHDLTPSQYNVLRILRGESQPMPCLEVASRMIQVAPAITRVVDQLISRGWIEKRQSEQDRRVFLIELTSSGRKLLAKLDQPVLGPPPSPPHSPGCRDTRPPARVCRGHRQ